MHTIDAQQKSLGRVASEAARVLRGKDAVDFTPHEEPNTTVKIINASHLSISEKKKEGKMYRRFTGYNSGLKEESLERLLRRKGHAEALRRAVKGMLPANRLRKRMLTKLVIEE